MDVRQRRRQVDVENLKEEQLVNVIDGISQKIIELKKKAVEEANRLLEPYGLHCDFHLVMASKNEDLPGQGTNPSK